MNQVLKLLFASCILLGVSAQASERPKVGLALSGGGARGAAHIGVLRELERQRIPIDYIAGTSMGAIVGGLYAAGNSTTRIEQILNEIDWKDIFRDQPERQYKTIRRKLDDSLFQLDKKIGVKNSKLQLPSGLIQGQKLQLLLDRLFASEAEVVHFDDLAVPFRAVATDITSGEAVVLEDKNLATAIRASMSVPSIFATVKINDFILVDGGISNNLPVDVVRDMGADVVIAVDIGTPLQPREKLQDIVGVSAQLSSLLVRNTTKRQLATLTEKDILIAPELGEFSAADFSSAAEIIVNGVTAARGAAAQLKPISIPSSEKFELVAVENNPNELYTVITAIRINNRTSLADEYVRNKLTQQLESELDLDQLEKDISTIYGLGILESVTYDVVPQEHGNELVLHVTEKPYGPRYLQFGLRFVSDFRKYNELTAIAGYTITPLNSWNGEWRTIMRLGEESGLITELYQPLSLNSKYFLNTSLFHRNQRFRTFEDGIIVNEIRSKKLGGSIALGRELDRWGDLRLGITRFEVDDDLEFGIIDEPLEQYDGGEYSVSLRFDTLDDVYFPTTGVRGFLRFNSSDSDLGADNEFDQAQIDGLNVASWGKHTLFLGARFYSTIDGDAPVQSYFRTGGLFTLPGYIDNELSGTDLYLIRTGYQQKLSGVLGTSPYLGLTLQYGKIYQDSDEISLSDGITAGGLWLGWETPIGPVYLGYGRADTNNQSLYLSVGRFF